IFIKAVPSFYGISSLEWMPYCMSLLGAEVYRSGISFVLPMPASYSQYTKGRRWALNKALKAGLKVEEVTDYRPFWERVLVPNLWERHGVKPVHTVEEIQWLADNNVPFIRQIEVREGGKLIAGTTVFETQTTAHAQYIAASPRGKELSALDLLIDHLVQKEIGRASCRDMV